MTNFMQNIQWHEGKEYDIICKYILLCTKAEYQTAYSE